MAKEAAGRGVLVSAGRHWFPAEAPAPYPRLSFAGVRPEWLAEAVESLARMITDTAPD